MPPRAVKLPIHDKVMLLVVLALLLALSGAGAYALHGRRSSLEEALDRRARAILAGLAATTSEAILTERSGALSELAVRIFREDQDVQLIRITDAAGRLLAESPTSPERAGPAFHYREFVSRQGFPLGSVELGLRTTRVREAVDEATVFLLLTLLDTVLLVGFTVHMALRGFVTRPLERLSQGTVRLSRGDFGTPVLHAGRDELGVLADAFNEMAKSLAAYRQQVADDQSVLETRVNDRTRELGEAQARTAAILAHLPVSVLVVGPGRELATANPAARELLGEGPLVPGRDCASILDTEYCRQDCLLARARRGEPNLETTRLGGGPDRTVLLECSPLDDGGLVTVRDVTRLEALAEAVRRQDRLSSLGTLAAGLAHELNNPLGNVSTYAQLLAEAPGDRDRAQKLTSTLKSEAERAAGIVGRLLAFARAPSESRVAIDLREVGRTCRDLLEPVCARDRVSLGYSEPDHPVPVEAVPGLLHQVLVNLVRNAVQATGPGGRVTLVVASEPEPGFHVLDDGPGLDPAILDRVFDPFFTTKEPGEGTGLGLSVCYGIVRDHGGRISLANRPEGGAMATVHLPPAAPSAPTRPGTPAGPRG